MARYATLQYKQRFKLPQKPYARTRQHQRYRLCSPAWERACVVQLYEDTQWLKQHLPLVQTLIQQTNQAAVGALPLDVVLNEQGEAVGLLLPIVEGRNLLSALDGLEETERIALAYRVFLLAGQLEAQSLPAAVVFHLSQFVVDEAGRVDWQWNEAALLLFDREQTNYVAWWAGLLPMLSLNNKLAPTTGWEAAATLLLSLPKKQAASLLIENFSSRITLKEQRLPIPSLYELDKTLLKEIVAFTTTDWPELHPTKRSLSPHPQVATIETAIWVACTASILIGLNVWLLYWAWPALQVAYTQALYAVIAAWLVGGTLLVGLSLIGGSYAALKIGNWVSAQAQRRFVRYFYTTHPHLQRVEDAAALAYYHQQQQHLKEQLYQLETDAQQWHKASKQCQSVMIRIRTQANRQLERAYEYHQAAYWQTQQAQQQQLLQALQRGEVTGLALQLQQVQQQKAQAALAEAHHHQVEQIKHRYWVIQSEQQQQWQHYKKEEWLLQQRLADWKLWQQAHWEKRSTMETAAEAWRLEDYQNIVG
jgi:hypothetical protein